MNIYNNNNVYPTLPSALYDDTAQTHRLQKVSEIEKFFLKENKATWKIGKEIQKDK